MFFIKKRKKANKHFDTLAENLVERKEKLLGEIKNQHQEVGKWAEEKGLTSEELVAKGARLLAATVATGAVVMTSGLHPGASSQADAPEKQPEHSQTTIKAKQDISQEVKVVIDKSGPADKKKLASELSTILKIPVTDELDKIRLNTNYGVIGRESHLTRYPGENLQAHFESRSEFQKYSYASMAGGPGAWGYIAPSRGAMTPKDIERERYYLVAQTFLSPNWGKSGVKEWFRHRKLVVINPQNGKVVIGVLEDAGPQVHTGSSFGGSPEVIDELQFRGGGHQVFVFFVDDPQDQVPLGGYGL